MNIQKALLGALFAGILLGSWTQASACEGKASSGSSASSQKGVVSQEMKDRAKEAVKAFLMKLKKDNPEEFARLMKLRESDPEAFRAEMKKLIKEEIAKRRSSGESSYASSGSSSSSGSRSKGVSNSMGAPLDLRK